MVMKKKWQFLYQLLVCFPHAILFILFWNWVPQTIHFYHWFCLSFLFLTSGFFHVSQWKTWWQSNAIGWESFAQFKQSEIRLFDRLNKAKSRPEHVWSMWWMVSFALYLCFSDMFFRFNKNKSRVQSIYIASICMQSRMQIMNWTYEVVTLWHPSFLDHVHLFAILLWYSYWYQM